MTRFQWLVALVLTTASTPAFCAAMRCPGNVESVPLRLVNRYQMIVPVSVNGLGPFDFLLDTGTESTVIGRALAHELHLPRGGKAVLFGVGAHARGDFGRVKSLAIGSRKLDDQPVAVVDLPGFVSSQSQIRGILGESFLAHFDALIDLAHLRICLDGTSTLRSTVGGRHIPLVGAGYPSSNGALPSELVISARLSDGMRPVRLLLDSGANQAFLYNAQRIMGPRYYLGVVMQGSAIDGANQFFFTLPQQDVQIGSLLLSDVPFFTLAGVNKDSRTPDFDGALAFIAFKQVFISPANRYVVIEPR